MLRQIILVYFFQEDRGTHNLAWLDRPFLLLLYMSFKGVEYVREKASLSEFPDDELSG
jgi:hypothetical protein